MIPSASMALLFGRGISHHMSPKQASRQAKQLAPSVQNRNSRITSVSRTPSVPTVRPNATLTLSAAGGRRFYSHTPRAIGSSTFRPIYPNAMRPIYSYALPAISSKIVKGGVLRGPCQRREYSNSPGIELSSYFAPDQVADLLQLKHLEGKTVLVTGSSRGIGLAIAKKMAEAGANVIITGKSVEEKANLPGTIYSARDEVKEFAHLEKQKIIAVPLDITRDDQVESLGDAIEKEFGTIDVCVQNAGALWWKNIDETPLKRLDLIMDVNFRGTFALTHMLIKRGLMKQGHFVMMSPPVDNWREFTPGKAGYSVSKLGMSMLAYALNKEYPKKYAAFSLWPKTLIESYATINFKIGDKSQWRRPDILADAILLMTTEPIDSPNLSGNWIDEDYLREKGINDFRVYRCDPESEPLPMDFSSISRGKVDEKV